MTPLSSFATISREIGLDVSVQNHDVSFEVPDTSFRYDPIVDQNHRCSPLLKSASLDGNRTQVRRAVDLRGGTPSPDFSRERGASETRYTYICVAVLILCVRRPCYNSPRVSLARDRAARCAGRHDVSARAIGPRGGCAPHGRQTRPTPMPVRAFQRGGRSESPPVPLSGRAPRAAELAVRCQSAAALGRSEAGRGEQCATHGAAML